jgi:hypothetical protein
LKGVGLDCYGYALPFHLDRHEQHRYRQATVDTHQEELAEAGIMGRICQYAWDVPAMTRARSDVPVTGLMFRESDP